MEDNEKLKLEVDTLAPERTVQEYLNVLLQDATSLAIVEAEAQVEIAVEVAEQVAALPEVAVSTPVTASVVTEVVEEPIVLKPVVTESKVDAESKVDTTPSLVVVEKAEVVSTPDVVEPVQSAAREWQHGRPPWAQETFDCLLFKVAGLTLAVPLAELGGVLNLDEDLTPLFGQPNWYLGLLPSKTAGTVKVVDTARWVMPEKYTDAAKEGLKFVILIEGSDWGMACHEVAEAISLTPDQVRWRSDRGRRPWLAGTVVEHMCAILDVGALVHLTDTGQRDGKIN